MKRRTVAAFLAAAALAALAAGYRFYDSGHAIGLLSRDGGSARHPFLLDPGKTRYTLIATGTVLPPYRGDVRIALEGPGGYEWEVHDSAPIIDLGLHRRPSLSGNILSGLRPRDRIALWVVLKPEKGRATVASEGTGPESVGEDGAACCPLSGPEETAGQGGIRGNKEGLALAFYDLSTGQRVMRMPVVFRGQGEGAHGGDDN